MVTIHIKVESNIHLAENAVEFKKKLLDQLSENTKNILEKNTPRKTSRGASNYKITKSDDKHEVTNDAFWLPLVNDGTGVYGVRRAVIRPKKAKVLHFTWRGKEWFLKYVKGQKPQKFVERSIPEILSSAESAVVIAKKGTLE